MAIVNNGTHNALPAAQLPTGYTLPVVTTFTDWQYSRILTLSILKSTVENATKSTTMTNIFTDAAIGINKQIIDIVAAAYVATEDVTTYASLTALSTNISENSSGDGTWLGNTAVSYTATVILYIKSL